MDFWVSNLDPSKRNCTWPWPYYQYAITTKAMLYEISRALHCTKETPPLFHDCFWEIHDMIHAFNENMAKVFIPSRSFALMSLWTFDSSTGCAQTGFSILANPTCFKTNYHTTCCGPTRIFSMEMADGNPSYHLLSLRTRRQLLACCCFVFPNLCFFCLFLDSGICVLNSTVDFKEKWCLCLILNQEALVLTMACSQWIL